MRNRILLVLMVSVLATASVAGCREKSEGGDDSTRDRDTSTTAVKGVSGGGILVPPEGSYYHGVFPGGSDGWEADITPKQVDEYERAVGRPVAWVYFSHNWFDGPEFPADTAGWIRDRGSVPFIRLMMRSKVDEVDGPDPQFPLRAIADGKFDGQLKSWGAAAAAFGTPLLVEFGTEVNIEGFPWNGTWNGKEDGPRLFREAYRRIVERVEAGGADNITWVFHVNETTIPDKQWNKFENYYPGSDIVDWVAVSVYGVVAPTDPDSWLTDFVEAMDDVVPRFAKIAPGKPVIVSELGAAGGHPTISSPEWTAAALKALLSDRWPAVRGFSWWNEHWTNDDNPAHDSELRVTKVPGLADVFRDLIGKNRDVVDRPILGRG